MIAVTVPEIQSRAWLRVEDFLMLSASGAFDDHAKTELIDGEILTMNAQFVRHAYAKSLLHLAVDRGLRAIGSRLIAVVEVAVALSPFDMPEPDIVIAPIPKQGGAVAAASVALLIEVADSTQRFDLGRKASVYARGQVPEYWVVDLTAREVIRHWSPGVEGFQNLDRTAFGVAVSSTTIAGLSVETDALNGLPSNT